MFGGYRVAALFKSEHMSGIMKFRKDFLAEVVLGSRSSCQSIPITGAARIYREEYVEVPCIEECFEQAFTNLILDF